MIMLQSRVKGCDMHRSASFVSAQIVMGLQILQVRGINRWNSVMEVEDLKPEFQMSTSSRFYCLSNI